MAVALNYQPMEATGGEHTPTKFESLVKYGMTYEVSQDVKVFLPEIYQAQRTIVEKPHVRKVPGCPDIPIEETENEDADKTISNAQIKQIMCTPRNQDGSITKDEMQNILDMILPPKVHLEEGRKWITPVSCMPATRHDLIKMQDKLDMYLKQSRARETGLCPIRARFFSELFGKTLCRQNRDKNHTEGMNLFLNIADELIRQITVICMEQGLLLVRIRNESQMTIKEYENLFASSTACAIRKALFAETSKTSMEAKIESTLARIEKKKTCLEKLEKIYASVDKKNIKRFEDMKARHAVQVANLKDSNQQLKIRLEGYILPRKAGPAGHE